jgi:hypothetical protein
MYTPGRFDHRIAEISSVLVSCCFFVRFPKPGIMPSSTSNNGGYDAWLLQMELRREEIEEATMEEDEGDSLGVHPPASERGTLAGISTTPNHQAMRSMNDQRNQEVQEGLPPRRPLHRLYRNNFHNLVHTYGVENTPRMHIPSNWDISRPRESDAGTSSWWPENKHIMVEVEKNTELIRQLLREIQSVREILMSIMKDKPTTLTM